MGQGTGMGTRGAGSHSFTSQEGAGLIKLLHPPGAWMDSSLFLHIHPFPGWIHIDRPEQLVMLPREATGFNEKDGNSRGFSSCGRVGAGSAPSLPLLPMAMAARLRFSIRETGPAPGLAGASVGLAGAHPTSLGAVAFPALPAHMQPLRMWFN